MPPQLREKDVVPDGVKYLAQVQADDVNCSSSIRQCRNPIVEDHQIFKAQSALSAAMVGVTDFLTDLLLVLLDI